jgi:hypothetical protein
MALTYQILINGVDRTANVIPSSLTISQILTSQPDGCTFAMKFADGASAVFPVAGQELIVNEVDGVTLRVFGGIIITPPRQFVDSTGEAIVNVTAQDFQARAARKLVALTFDGQTAGAIATAILGEAPAGFGFSIATVEAGPVLPKWVVNYENISDALERLAKSVGFEWYIDYFGRLNFFDGSSLAAFANAPWSLTQGATFPFAWSAAVAPNSFQYVEDVSQVRNVVTVRGARTASPLSTQTLIADGSRRTFIADLGEIIPGSLTMNIGAVPQLIGEEGKADAATVDWFVNYKNRSVFASKAGTPTPTAGAVITFQYFYETQLIVNARDEASIGVFGVWEHIISAPEVTDRTIANRVARADLNAYGTPGIGVRFTTSRPGLKAGQKIRVTVPRLNVTGLYLIRSCMTQGYDYAPNGTAHQGPGYFRTWAAEAEKVGA